MPMVPSASTHTFERMDMKTGLPKVRLHVLRHDHTSMQMTTYGALMALLCSISVVRQKGFNPNLAPVLKSGDPA